MLPVLCGPDEPDEKGFENAWLLAKRSLEQAAVTPPMTPMIAKRETARNNSPLRITQRPNAKLTDQIKGLLRLSFR